MSVIPEVVKEFPECPWCGSTSLGSELVVKHLKLRERGLLQPEEKPSIIKIPALLVKPTQIAMTVPMLIQETDCCGECGRNRTIRLSAMETAVSAPIPGTQQGN